MTFESAQSTTWGEFLGAIRDTVASMANWSVYDTSTNGGAASIGKDEWFVLETPTGEHIRFVTDHANNYGLHKEYGPAWDEANNTWADQYASDGGPGMRKDKGDYSGVGPASPVDTQTNMSESDPVTYWTEYVDGSGFAFYVERERGDGNDGDFAFAFAKVNPTWDYSTAASREADYAFSFSGNNAHGDDYGMDPGKEEHGFNHMCGSGTRASTGWGMVNPDANYSNFVYTDAICRSRRYRNSAGSNIIIGSHNLLLEDRSGGDSSHQDTTQDDTGANVYTLLGRDYSRVAMRMD